MDKTRLIVFISSILAVTSVSADMSMISCVLFSFGFTFVLCILEILSRDDAIVSKVAAKICLVLGVLLVLVAMYLNDVGLVSMILFSVGYIIAIVTLEIRIESKSKKD